MIEQKHKSIFPKQWTQMAHGAFVLTAGVIAAAEWYWAWQEYQRAPVIMLGPNPIANHVHIAALASIIFLDELYEVI